MDQFWLTDEQFARIAPLLPNDTRGKERVDDRRVISGIVHVLKSGGRWTDAPCDLYGPKKTLYNRFVRWAAKGIWIGLFETLAQAGWAALPGVLIDSTAVKAHRCAAGGKGGSKAKPGVAREGGRTTKIHALTDRFCRPLAFPADRRAGRRLQGGARCCSNACPPAASCWRTRATTATPFGGRSKRAEPRQYSAQDQPPLETVLLPGALSRAQRH